MPLRLRTAPAPVAITEERQAAHGYAARHFGDNTAYLMGRITLNPASTIPSAPS